MAKNNSMISTILLLFLSLLHHHNHHCHVDAAARTDNSNNPFLKEIMMGRCYDQQRQQQQNPTATATAIAAPCEDIINSFMNVLERHFESDLESLLENEFSKAFIIEKEKGQGQVRNNLFAPSSSSSPLKNRSSSASVAATPMIWMKFFGTNENSQTTNAVKNMLSLSNNNGDGGGYVTPETTFGGRLLDGLTFCAQNPNLFLSGSDGYDDGCSKENSNAYWSFWKAAYKSFTSQIIKGDGSSKLVLVIEDPFVDEQFLHDNVLMYLKNTSLNDANADDNQERGGAVTHIDIWGVDCNSSIVIKIMKFLYTNNDESTSSANHENEDNSSDKMIVTTACHGPDLIELGLCYNNVNNKNDRDGNDNDESNKACDQYKRGKYTRRGDGGETYHNDDENENEIEKSHKNDDDIISSNTTIETTLSPKKSNTHTGPEATVNDNNSSNSSNNRNREQMESNNYFLRFFFPSLVLLICIYYIHRYGYIIESYYYNRIGVNGSDYSDGDCDSGRGSSSKSGNSGSSAYSNYSSFVNPFIAGGSSSDNNNSRSNGSSSGQETGKRSSNNNKTNTNNNIAEGEVEGEGEQLLSLPYHCVSQ